MSEAMKTTEATTETAESIETAEGTKTAVRLPETAWQRMSTPERTVYLVPLIGQQVRYTLLRTYREGVELFGPAYPLPWVEVRLLGLDIVNRMLFKLPGAQFSMNNFGGGLNMVGGPFGTASLTYPFDDLYDVQPLVVKESPTKAEAAEPETEPDYDGADVYAADEVACPHCGETLRITQRATVERATETTETDGEEEATSDDAC